MRCIDQYRSHIFYKILTTFFVFIYMFSFFLSSVTSAQMISSSLNLPQVGTRVGLSPIYDPALLHGITIDPSDPMHFEFIVTPGDSALEGDALKIESEKLVRYFLTAMTVPEKDLWVNLSPYENNRIIPESFSQTEMGRDLLAQDYILKQLTSSLMFPEEELGKKFWEKIEKKLKREHGMTDLSTSVFNKVWIMPDTVTIYEHGHSAFVVHSRLKVLLDTDYLAMQESSAQKNTTDILDEKEASISDVIRSVIIPEIEKEVNQGENFAKLRQVYNSLILASWFKKTFHDSFMSQVYVNKNKVAGVDLAQKDAKQIIYNQYIDAYKTGVYNYIKDEYDASKQELVPKKYFSGGVDTAMLALDDKGVAQFIEGVDVKKDNAALAQTIKDNLRDPFSVNIQLGQRNDLAMVTPGRNALDNEKLYELEMLENGPEIKESRSKKTILLLEEYVATADIYIQELKGVGYQVISVSTEEEVFKTINSQNIDLVLAEVELPGMDAPAFIKKLAEVKPDLPLVINTENYLNKLDDIVNMGFENLKAGFVKVEDEMEIAVISRIDNILEVTDNKKIGERTDVLSESQESLKVNMQIKAKRFQKTILLVEDYEPTADLYTQDLEFAGYKVIPVSTRAAALDIVNNKDIDLVIMDIEMLADSEEPLLQGLLELNPELPVIINTDNILGNLNRVKDKKYSNLKATFIKVDDEMEIKVIPKIDEIFEINDNAMVSDENNKFDKQQASQRLKEKRAEKTVLLVVQGDATTGLYIKDLSTAGYQVLSVTTESDVFETLESETIDLLITDAELKETDGVTFMQGLLMVAPDMPVVIKTGDYWKQLADIENMKFPNLKATFNISDADMEDDVIPEIDKILKIDQAMLDTLGGIQFDPSLIDMSIERDGGAPLINFNFEGMPGINLNTFEGLYIDVINILPANLPLLLGLKDRDHDVDSLSFHTVIFEDSLCFRKQAFVFNPQA